MTKRILCVLLSILLCGSYLNYIPAKANETTVGNTTALYTATDDLNRTLDTTTLEDSSKVVGLFYFLWLGADSAEGPYDVSEIIANNSEAASSNEAWIAAGGGKTGERHWWGESLFGYYRSTDEWVIERDVQMLTDAGVDFLALDYSNGNEYQDQLLVLLKTLDKYYKQGYDVPQLTFLTFVNPVSVVPSLIENVYDAYPEYEHLWYQVDEKPLLLLRTKFLGLSAAEGGFSSEQFESWSNKFTIRNSRWPRDTDDTGYGEFPWMDFNNQQEKYAWADGTTIMSVSVAQNNATLISSTSAFYNDEYGETYGENHTRNWDGTKNITDEDAYLQGYNFKNQFEYAIEQDPNIIFITGWNEWIATRQYSWDQGAEGYPVITEEEAKDKIILVDNADINNSRDIQPMSGGYGDNYYMQMIDYIRKFKGNSSVNRNLDTETAVSSTTIDVTNSFSQWNIVKPFYLDYTQDITSRNAQGFGGIVYEDYTGRNDLSVMKVVNDNKNLYFYAETVANISGIDEEKCMTLFLSTGTSEQTWENYDFRTVLTSDGVVLEQYDGASWIKKVALEYRVDGNQLQLAIPLETLGYVDAISVDFKWVDNYQDGTDIYSFYLYGDAAPYGRLNYHYTGVCETAVQEYGDVTVDGGTDSKDLVRMKKDILESKDVQPYGDMNADELYNNTDIDLLRKYMVGMTWPTTAITSAMIEDFELTGFWKDGKLEIDGKSDAIEGPLNSYDGGTILSWEPVAQDAYGGNPGIIYTLNHAYDLECITLTFDKEYYFKLYTSQDGLTYNTLPVVEVNADSGHYTTVDGNSICNIKLSKTTKADGVRYVKFVFTGSVDDSTSVQFKEIELQAEKQKSDTNQIEIIGHEVLGTWSDDTTTVTEAAKASYDGSITDATKWNSKVAGASISGYSGNPGVVYKWNGYYDLDELTLVRNTSRYYYYDVYVSTDDIEYTLAARVTADNYQNIVQFNEDGSNSGVYTIKLSSCNNISSIKIMFTGDSATTNTYLNLYEVTVTGTPAKGVSQKAVIESGTIDDTSILTTVGTIANSYDGKISTKWNPQVTNFTKVNYVHTINGNTYQYSTYDDKPSVTYKLDGNYDLDRIKLQFADKSSDYKTYRFNVYVSQDGTYYTKAASVFSENNVRPDGYAGETFTLCASEYKNIQYIRLEITGSGISTAWINLHEISVYGTKRVNTANDVAIVANNISGWSDGKENSASVGPQCSYDGNSSTNWNPQASGSATAYTGTPNIVYTLDGVYDLSQLALTFGNNTRIYYFDLYCSTDNVDYSKVVSINANNAADYYNLVNEVQACAIDISNAKTVKYVKIVFTGTATDGGSTYVVLKEVDITGTKLENPVLPIGISSYELEGTWIKDQSDSTTASPSHSYDGKLTTRWNPQAQYSTDPAIIYKLQEYYDIDTISVTFENEMYFDVYVSADNETFTAVASVTEDNQDDYCQTGTYYAYSFELPMSETSRYLKLVVNGRKDSTNGWFGLCEVAVTGQTVEAPIVDATITAHEVTGTWINTQANNASVGPAKSYDGNSTSKWNPQAQTSYTGTPGIIYTLDKTHDLSTINLIFGSRKYHFDVYVSGDGTTYTQIDSITDANKTERFTLDYVCTINLAENTSADSVKYIKIVFTGADSGSTYVNLMEVEVSGTVE